MEMKTVAVASGKGGTGKTLVSTGLAWVLAQSGRRVAYVDTDVEEPNGHLLLNPTAVQEHRFALPVPRLRGSCCSACGACERGCSFGAIRVVGQGITVQGRQCHSCGACLLVCEEGALTEAPREVGTIHQGEAGPLAFWSASLDVGERKAAPLIRGLVQRVAATDPPEVRILDVSPGTSCSAMAATRHAQQVLLVTEPTPFGLHDLALAWEMCNALKIPVGVVLNRADLAFPPLVAFLRDRRIPLLAEIPFSRETAEAYARQELPVRAVPDLARRMEQLARRIL